MKVAISSTGKDLSSSVSDVFGRCPYFIIVDIEDNKVTKFDVIDNLSSEQAGSAGISAAKIVVAKGVEAVITRNVGPRALDVLKQFKIEIYDGIGSVDEAVKKFISKKLDKIKQGV